MAQTALQERELKFRAWDETNKKWAYEGFNLFGEVTIFDLLKQYQFEEACKSLSFQQYTGLKDKNGKDCYDGDIVKVTNKGIYNGNKVVVWDNILLCYILVWAEKFSKWEGTQSGTTFLKVSSGIKCEIIGNIYETPH